MKVKKYMKQYLLKEKLNSNNKHMNYKALIYIQQYIVLQITIINNIITIQLVFYKLYKDSVIYNLVNQQEKLQIYLILKNQILLVFIHSNILINNLFNQICLIQIKDNKYLIKLDGLIIFLYPIMEIVKF